MGLPAQDTDSPQYKLTRLLQGDAGTLFVVGDPDQAIYGWRGADSSHMEAAMEAEFSGLTTHFLRTNYRWVGGCTVLGMAEDHVPLRWQRILYRFATLQ